MKFPAVGILLLQSLAIGSSTPGGTVLAERVHSRDIVKRVRDCGVFTMACDLAGNACNNACYHIYCQPGGGASRTMVYDATNSDTRNRMQSGCQSSNSRSVCNSSPFGQTFHDPQNPTPGDLSINCNEWPMATTKQIDFVPGQIRNSLRCIDQRENSSGGAQLQAFIRGDTPTRGQRRTCPGTIQDGDSWQVVFDLANANPSKTQFCTNPGACANDVFQFHMTARNGPLDYPYNPATMNRYTQEGTGGKDLLQCSALVHRQGDKLFNIYVYDNTGTEKGRNALSAFSTPASVIVTGLPATLKFTRTGPFSTSGAGMGFIYNSSFPPKWFGDTVGSSPYGPASPAGGAWCAVTNTQPAVQDVRCFFPCPAA